MYITRRNATPDLTALAQVLGYKRLPPDIDEFLDDPYYLGKSVQVFPFWREKLREIYPTPIHTTTPFISLNCAIGSGKSTVAKIMELYLECRLDHLEDISILGIGKYLTKPICSYFFHTSVSKAEEEFVGSLELMKSNSAYFTRGLLNPKRKIEYVCDSNKINAGIGRDILFFNFSEVNFLDYQKTYNKVESGMGRFTARFISCQNFFGNVILDSSPSSTSSMSVDFIKRNPQLNIYTVYAPIWEAHKHKNIYFKQGSIQVYLGDSNYDPFVIDEERPLTEDMDRDLIITVPKELEREFRADVIKAIQDKAGISTDSTGSFFKNKDKLNQVFTLPVYNKDVIICDMFDQEDTIMNHLQTSINMLIPKEKTLFIRLDLGVVKDHTGLSIGYLDSYYYPNPTDKKVKLPKYKIPISVAISRYSGQETSITKITEFILQLSRDYSIGGVSADSFQSRNMLQDLKIAGFNVKDLSVDKTTTAYNYLKNVIYNKHIELPQNKLLMKELKELQVIGSKVDHPADGCFSGDSLILTDQGAFPMDYVVKNYTKFKVQSSDRKFYPIKKAIHTKSVNEILEIIIGEDIYRCTPEHLFLIGDEWVEARNTDFEKFIIESEKSIPVYDIEVDGPYPNFALSNGQIVHNSKDIADSVSGLVLHIFNNLDEAEKPSSINLKERTINLVDMLNGRKFKDVKKIETDLLSSTLQNIW